MEKRMKSFHSMHRWAQFVVEELQSRITAPGQPLLAGFIVLEAHPVMGTFGSVGQTRMLVPASPHLDYAPHH